MKVCHLIDDKLSARECWFLWRFGGVFFELNQLLRALAGQTILRRETLSPGIVAEILRP